MVDGGLAFVEDFKCTGEWLEGCKDDCFVDLLTMEGVEEGEVEKDDLAVEVGREESYVEFLYDHEKRRFFLFSLLIFNLNFEHQKEEVTESGWHLHDNRSGQYFLHDKKQFLDDACVAICFIG